MLKPPLDAQVHTELHRQVSMVPVPHYLMAEYVLKNFMPVRDDYMASLEDLMFSFHESTKLARVGHIERQVGHLVVEALEAQRPFIQEGLING